MKISVDRIYETLSTAFGLGYLPIAPGTWGSLFGVGIYAAISLVAPYHYRGILVAVALLIVCILSVPLGSWAERFWGETDPKPFVLDEVAGFLFTVLLFRTSDLTVTLIWAFVASRVFDILKPWPAGWLERIHGGWGILLDDLCASLYAGIALNILAYHAEWLFWPLF
jgi:phosphatidylglycerophosphatase A